jgi:hypothetical protein
MSSTDDVHKEAANHIPTVARVKTAARPGEFCCTRALLLCVVMGFRQGLESGCRTAAGRRRLMSQGRRIRACLTGGVAGGGGVVVAASYSPLRFMRQTDSMQYLNEDGAVFNRQPPGPHPPFAKIR